MVFGGALVVLVLAIENLGLELTAVPLRVFIAYLPRSQGAVLLMFIGSMVAVVAASALGASLAKIDFSHHKFLAGVVRVMILVITFVATIEHLGFDISLLTDSLTSLVIIASSGLAITFALGGREVARNLLAGYYVRERFQAGDQLILPEGTGELVSIGAVSCEVELEDGSVVIPNNHLIEKSVRKAAAAVVDQDG